MRWIHTWWLGGALVLGLSLLMALLRGWPADWPLLARLALASLVPSLGWLWFFMSLRNLTRAAAGGATGSARWSWPAWLTLALMLMTTLLGFAWFASVPPLLETSAVLLESKLFPDKAAQRVLAATPNRSVATGHWLWQDGTERRLPSRTNLKPGTKPEVFLKFADPNDAAALVKSKVYVRAFAFGHYADGAWSARGGHDISLETDSSGWVVLSPLRPRKLIHHEVFHAVDASGNTPLVALQGAVAAAIGPLRRHDDGVLLLPPSNQIGGYQYRVASQPLLLDDLPDGQWLRPPTTPLSDELELPVNPELRRRLRELARMDDGAADLKSQLLQLRKSLQSRYAYSLQTTNPEQLDPLENFLFHEQRGHCEHFATAAALMARSLGLPARIAYGWSGGTWFDSSGLLMFRASEAHAWAEVFLDSFGWVVLDATPPGATAPSRVAAADESLAKALDEGKSESDSAMAEVADSDSTQAWPIWPAWGIAVLVGLFVWWQLGCRAKHHLRQLNVTGASFDHRKALSPPDYLLAWNQACRESGLPVSSAMPLREQLRKLDVPPPFADALWRYHYAITFENQARSLDAEQHLLREIESPTWRGSPTSLSETDGSQADSHTLPGAVFRESRIRRDRES